MNGYEKPLVVMNDGASEGVYMASGAASGAVNHAHVKWNTGGAMPKELRFGDNVYWETVSWWFEGGEHSKGGMKLTVTLDRPCKYYNPGTPFVSLESGDGTMEHHYDVALGTKYAGCQGSTLYFVSDSGAPRMTAISAQCYGD